MKRTLLQLSSLVLTAVVVSGCGAPVADVMGLVSFDGRKLASGTVMAIGPDGVPHYATIEDGGRYTLNGMLPGRTLWAVTSPDPNAELVQRPRPGAALPHPAPAATSINTNRTEDSGWFAIPARYEATSTSGLVVELHVGANDFEINLAP